MYIACMQVMDRYPQLKLRSIFFGIYERRPEGALVDESGQRFSYRHIAVAVSSALEEFGARLLAGIHRVSDIPGDQPGSIGETCFYRSPRSSMIYPVTAPEDLDRFVLKSLDLENRLGRQRWFGRMLAGLCGGGLRLARILRFLNRARSFHTVDVRSADPSAEIGQDATGRRIGLIMFVSSRRDITPDEIAAPAEELRRIFYDLHLIRSSARDALRVSSEIFFSLVEMMPLAHAVHDGVRFLYINPRGLEILGVRSKEELNQRTLLEIVHPDFQEAARERFRKLRTSPAGSVAPIAEQKFIRKDGQAVYVETASSKVDYFGAEAFQLVFNDITERKRLEEERERNKLYDPLTGLANRLLFLDRLNEEIGRLRPRLAAGERRLIAALYIDINNFRHINDLFQFNAGDLLLREIGERLRYHLGVHSVARLTGDKFGIFLPDLDNTEQAIFFVESLQDIFRLKPFRIGEQEIPVSFSTGIAFFPHDADSAEELLSNGEIALSRIRGLRNMLSLYDRAMNARSAALFETERELLRALEQRQFELFYQPQIDGSGRIHGCEALLRWRHPERGLISPDAFINVAEERGIIVEIGQWSLEEATRQAAGWQSPGGRPVTLSINVAPRQVEHPDFVRIVRGALERSGLAPKLLTLEIVERGIVEESEHIRHVMAQLSGLGVRFHVDDFGVGGSAISYVRSFPIESIKIDKSFVFDLQRHEKFVRGLIAFAHSMGLGVIEEGVESLEQLSFFKRLQCSIFQGYYFARPLPLAEFERFLSTFERMNQNNPLGRSPGATDAEA